MKLTWLGAAGFKIDTHEGAVILIDPFLSRPVKANPPLPIKLADLSPVDEILLTSSRFDHVADTPALVEQTGAIVHAPSPICEQLVAAGVSPHNLECTMPGRKKRVGSLTWQALTQQTYQPKKDSPLSDLGSTSTQETVAYLFKIADLVIIHFGSAGWIETDIESLHPNIALLPIDRPANKTNIVLLASLLNPNVIIPHHWDDYYPPISNAIDLTDFISIMQDELPSTKIYRPAIGQPFNVTGLA